jgi:hypothetical protein
MRTNKNLTLGISDHIIHLIKFFYFLFLNSKKKIKEKNKKRQRQRQISAVDLGARKRRERERRACDGREIAMAEEISAAPGVELGGEVRLA